MRLIADDAVVSLRMELAMQLARLPAAVRRMTLTEFRARYRCDTVAVIKACMRAGGRVRGRARGVGQWE